MECIPPGKTLFNNFEHLPDGTLTVCQPDRYYGETLISDAVQSTGELAKMIVPSIQRGRPTVWWTQFPGWQQVHLRDLRYPR